MIFAMLVLVLPTKNAETATCYWMTGTHSEKYEVRVNFIQIEAATVLLGDTAYEISTQ